ncbi:hypothetical protein GCM10010524_37400 [Streptomyces mexicanus]
MENGDGPYAGLSRIRPELRVSGNKTANVMRSPSSPDIGGHPAARPIRQVDDRGGPVGTVDGAAGAGRAGVARHSTNKEQARERPW